MKAEKIFFILSLLSILLLIFLTQTTKEHAEIINSIEYSSSKITIITESNQTLILFDTTLLNLKPKDKISFNGRPETYKEENQIIIHKIQKLK